MASIYSENALPNAPPPAKNREHGFRTSASGPDPVPEQQRTLDLCPRHGRAQARGGALQESEGRVRALFDLSLELTSLLTLLALFFPGKGLAGEQVEVLAEDDAAPWSLKDGTGYANDVVRAAFHAAEVDIKLQVVPYARAKRMTIAGKAVACFSMSWLPEFADKIVFSDKPLFTCQADYFHNLSKPLTAKREDELARKIIVGTVVGYEYPPSFCKLRDKGLIEIEATTSEKLNLKKLAAGRLDAAVTNCNKIKTAEYEMAKAGVSGKVGLVFHGGVLESFIGFSKAHPRGLWARDKFNAGFQIIAADGTLRKIEDQWAGKAKTDTERVPHPTGGAEKTTAP
jgi:ABC-type amino acid transport substrate-binding protein